MRKFIVGAGLVVASFGLAGVAGAAPKSNVEVYTCDGEVTEIVVAGRSGWIDGEHYLAHNVVINGSFDFTDPTVPTESFTDTQWTTGQTGGLQCVASFTETTPEGVGVYTITLNAIATK